MYRTIFMIAMVAHYTNGIAPISLNTNEDGSLREGFLVQLGEASLQGRNQITQFVSPEIARIENEIESLDHNFEGIMGLTLLENAQWIQLRNRLNLDLQTQRAIFRTRLMEVDEITYTLTISNILLSHGTPATVDEINNGLEMLFVTLNDLREIFRA